MVVEICFEIYFIVLLIDKYVLCLCILDFEVQRKLLEKSSSNRPTIFILKLLGIMDIIYKSLVH